MWHVFICHASEDKDEVARPLAEHLDALGLNVWYDEFTLFLGDSLRQSIDKGLANSRFGVVILSPDFFKKDWPQKELDGLFAREVDGQKVILPVWHNIEREEVLKYSPIIADRFAAKTVNGLDSVVSEIIRVIDPTSTYIGRGKLSGVKAPLVSSKTDDFHGLIDEADARFEMLRSQSDSEIVKKKFGRWTIAHQIVPAAQGKSLRELNAILEQSEGKETGWPIGVVMSKGDLRPRPWNDILEAWIVTQATYPQLDYWFAKPSGFFYVTRAFHEDIALEEDKPLFEWIIPIWRMAEGILHATRVASAYGTIVDCIQFFARYQGLTNRVLWNNRPIMVAGPARDYVCRTDVWSKEIIVPPDLHVESLPDTVQTLLQPLYEKFDLFEMPAQVYKREIIRMLQGTW